MEGVSAEEAKAVKALQRVARKWPESLWLFSASGTLCVMKKVARLFGYAENTSASTLVRKNLLPVPSARGKGLTNPSLQWTVADLKKYERECKIVVDK